MRHLLLLLSLGACTDGSDKSNSGETGAVVDTADTADSAVKPPEIILGDPYAVVVGASSPGSWASTCELDLKLVDNSDGSTAATIELAARGCDWAGAPLKGGTQYKGAFSATGCVAGQDKTYESSTFSGEKGYIFALWYTGVNIGYSALEQGSESGDFYGGQAQITVANSYPDSNMQAIAAEIDATATLSSTAASGNVYQVAWESELNVGEALSHFTAAVGTDFVAGEPIWIAKPSWWPKCAG
jgi:hypothetical protein